ncbi:MAG: restriction endonuclease subunit S [Minisyncoccales bacterium]
MKNNWQIKKLGEIGIIFNGNSINKKIKKEKYFNTNDGIPFIATKDIDLETHLIDFNNGVKIPSTDQFFKIAHKNSVLICAEGGSAGKKIAFNEKDVCFGNKLFAIETKKDIDTKFVYYWYLHPDFLNNFKSQMKGIIGGVSIGNFKKLEITIPHIYEQQRIVKILDDAFEKVTKAKEYTEKNLQNSKDLFESYLQSIFSNPENNWGKRNFEECIDKIIYTKKIQKNKFLPSGKFPIVSQEKDLINGYWNKESDLFKLKTSCIVFGDHTKVLKYIDFNFVLGADGVKILQPKFFLYPKFLFYFLNSIILKDLGYARHYRLLKEKAVPFPKAISEQKSIAFKLDILSNQTKKLELIYEQKLKSLEELKKSILRRAFNGDL